MKIKSLLLGSAAALVAVSGAKAADAIVVEAEPMEYVKVCDTYGSGYFYIPGTETCLKFGGNIRVQYTKQHKHTDQKVSDHDTDVRLRFTIDAKNETEYGTLSSAARVSWTRDAFNSTATEQAAPLNLDQHDARSDDETSDAGGGLDYATISLAGFTVGYSDSRLSLGQWNSAVTEKANFLDYTYSAGDIALSVGIQDAAGSGAAGQPDPYAKLSYNGEGYGFTAYAAYDTSEDAAFYGVIGNMDLSSFVPGGKFTAFWEGDDYDGETIAACAVWSTNTADACGGTDYAKGHNWGVRLDYQVMDGLTGYTRYAEHRGFLSSDRTADTVAHGARRAWKTGLTWAVASGLSIDGSYNKTIESGEGTFELNITRSF